MPHVSVDLNSDFPWGVMIDLDRERCVLTISRIGLFLVWLILFLKWLFNSFLNVKKYEMNYKSAIILCHISTT